MNDDHFWNSQSLVAWPPVWSIARSHVTVWRHMRILYNTNINNLISPDNSTNPKRLYSYIKNQRKYQSGIQQLQDKDGFIRSDSLTKANILNQHFQSVCTQNEDISTIPDKGISPHPLMQHITITPTGIHKATEPDHIPTKLLKTLADELTPTFTLFFQASLKQGKIRIDWTTANVVPIFKKGDRLQPINYRPISLTSITFKMLEHIITSNIMQHLDAHNILHDAQHGFSKHRSTETQLIQLIDNLAHNIDNRIQTDAILLDFQKSTWQSSSPPPPLQTKILWHLTTTTQLGTLIPN